MGYSCKNYNYDCYNPKGIDYKYIENEICENWWYMLTDGIGQCIALFGQCIEDSLKDYFFCCKQTLKEVL